MNMTVAVNQPPNNNASPQQAVSPDKNRGWARATGRALSLQESYGLRQDPVTVALLKEAERQLSQKDNLPRWLRESNYIDVHVEQNGNTGKVTFQLMGGAGVYVIDGLELPTNRAQVAPTTPSTPSDKDNSPSNPPPQAQPPVRPPPPVQTQLPVPKQPPLPQQVGKRLPPPPSLPQEKEPKAETPAPAAPSPIPPGERPAVLNRAQEVAKFNLGKRETDPAGPFSQNPGSIPKNVADEVVRLVADEIDKLAQGYANPNDFYKNNFLANGELFLGGPDQAKIHSPIDVGLLAGKESSTPEEAKKIFDLIMAAQNSPERGERAGQPFSDGQLSLLAKNMKFSSGNSYEKILSALREVLENEAKMAKMHLSNRV